LFDRDLQLTTERKLFVTALTISGVVFGIPALIFFMKILAGLFAGASWERQSYMYDTFIRDVTWLVVLGLAAALPPLVVYLNPSLKPMLVRFMRARPTDKPTLNPPSHRQPPPLRESHKFCPFCGEQIISSATYCKYCYKAIE